MSAKKSTSSKSKTQRTKTQRKSKRGAAVLTNVYRKQDNKKLTNKDYVLAAMIDSDDNVDVAAMADRLPGLCEPHTSQKTGKRETAAEARERAERTIRAWLSGFRNGGGGCGYPRSVREPALNKRLVAMLKRNGLTESAKSAAQYVDVDLLLQ